MQNRFVRKLESGNAVVMDESARISTARACYGATPVAFGECVGFLHAGRSRIGVLMLSPLGFEDMTIRTGWARLAERLSSAGFAALRFDPPGVGDALGEDLDLARLDQWRAAIQQAAECLRARGGVREIVLLGQGLGALLALDMAACATGLIILAPAAEGVVGMREFSIWGAMISDFLHIPNQTPEGAIANVAGFLMSSSLAEDFKHLRLARAPGDGVRRALALIRPNRVSDERALEILRARQTPTDVLDYGGYDAFIAHDATPRVPLGDFERIVDWMRTHEQTLLGDSDASAPPPDDSHAPAPHLANSSFQETPFVFGPCDRLFGVLCRPAKSTRAIAIIINSGYNPHIGWARAHVRLARRLAVEGVASLRMDLSGLGESAPDPRAPENPLYSLSHIADACAAIDAIAQTYREPIVLVGRCSGAYLAVEAAVRRPNVAGLTPINAVRLIWDPRETLDDALRDGTSSLADYRARAMNLETISKILKRETPIGPMSVRVGRKLRAILEAKAALFLGPLMLRGQMRIEARKRFRLFAQRGVQINLVYAGNDAGLDQLAAYFGPNGADLARAPNVVIDVVPQTEHNMTSRDAQARMFENVMQVVERIGAQNSQDAQGPQGVAH